MTIKILSLFLYSFIFFSHCSFECATHPGKDKYQEIREIPYQNEIERKNKLLSYSIEEQIDTFLYAEKCGHDGRVTHIFYITASDKVVKIAERLRAEKDSENKLILIWALEHIEVKCQCVRENPEVINIVTQVNNPFSDSKSESGKSQERMYDLARDYLISKKEKQTP